MAADHIAEDDMERYLLGKVTQEEELALLEEHLLNAASASNGRKKTRSTSRPSAPHWNAA
jgi:hypothetical protein